MSTSDPAKLITALPETQVPTELSAAAAGMPDPAILAQMATELFGAFSTRDVSGAGPSTAQKNAVTPENKKRVVEQTMSAGAFGAPWIVAVNNGGERKASRRPFRRKGPRCCARCH